MLIVEKGLEPESERCTPVSTDAEGEPEAEVRRRLRDETSLSSKGFGRVELGSGEVLGSGTSEATGTGSIWPVRKSVAARSVEVQRRHGDARAVWAAAIEN
jgi:hypothetical protein